MTLLERITKAQAERHCVLCGTAESQHKAPHAFRAEPVRRFAAKDMSGWNRAA